MKCFRVESLDEPDTYCQEMASLYMGDEAHPQCFCFGVIDPQERIDPEYSKRLCIVAPSEEEDEEMDISLDLSDVDAMAIQTIISCGTLGILKRARVPMGDN